VAHRSAVRVVTEATGATEGLHPSVGGPPCPVVMAVYLSTHMGGLILPLPLKKRPPTDQWLASGKTGRTGAGPAVQAPYFRATVYLTPFAAQPANIPLNSHPSAAVSRET